MDESGVLYNSQYYLVRSSCDFSADTNFISSEDIMFGVLNKDSEKTPTILDDPESKKSVVAMNISELKKRRP